MKIETTNGVTLMTCIHVEKFNAKNVGGKISEPLEGAAPLMAGIELEPGTVFMCCSWCAAFVQRNALTALVKEGVKVTLEPAPK